MKRASKRLAELLPKIHASLDERFAGRPLGALLDVLGGELDALDAAVDQLYDDHFVERASPEGLLLLAELLGARLLGADPRAHRAVIARAVAFRRRKGTLATLEELVALASGYDAEVDEGFRSLLFTQDLNDLLVNRGRTATLIDPIALADPLSRAPFVHRPGFPPAVVEDLLAARPGEGTDDTLRRLGRADAGRAAVSPRFVDIRGWARPEGVLVRTSHFVAFELENAPAGTEHTRSDGRRVFSIDALDRPTHVLWEKPHEPPERIPARTIVHEPGGLEAPARTGAEVLTPTALAAQPDLVERSGALTIAVEGVTLVGPEAVPLAGEPMIAEPTGPEPRLRFADPSRPCAGDAFALTLVAHAPAFERDMIAADATPGVITPSVLLVSPDDEISGMTIAVRVKRVAGTAAIRRGATSAWEPFAVGPSIAHGLSGLGVVAVGGKVYAARVELDSDPSAARVAVIDPDVPGAYQTVQISGETLPNLDGMSVVTSGATMFVAGCVGPDLVIYKIDFSSAQAASCARLDAGSVKRPRARKAPAMTIAGDLLYVFGGIDGNAILGDLWSISLVTGSYTPHFARRARPRAYATLLSIGPSLVLLGGESTRGALERAVDVLDDPTLARPAWRVHSELPIDAARPGQLFAQADGAGLMAVVWSDRTRPAVMKLAGLQASWKVGPLETDGAPNPPAHGEGVFVGDDFFVGVPAPLPPSEVLFAIGGKSRLAFLPALDLLPTESRTFLVDENGGTRRSFGLGETSPTFTRMPYDGVDARAASAARLSVTGRLAVSPYRLRQRILGDWNDSALLADQEDVVGLDPRDGRVILPAGAPQGRLSVSYRRGTGASIGAGPMPPDRSVPAYFREPDDPPRVPPDLGSSPAPVTAWVFPARAGLPMPGSDAPIVASLNEAVAASYRADTQVIAVDSSARIRATRVASLAARSFSIVAADFGDVPFFAPGSVAADAPSLSIAPDFGGIETTELWLAGLWIGGRLDLEMARGRVDLRYCTIGRPGAAAVRVAGAQHQVAPMRRSLHVPEMTVVMYGCVAGAIEVPPWVRLVAAGCTFDGGSHDGAAVRAAGATVELRHCTVRGTVEAGALQASSCAFSGAVTVDRPDLGWIRWSLLRRDRGRPPRLYHSPHHPVSFASVRETDPHYLVLADNNGAPALSAGELGRVPGAHAERTDRRRELTFRTTAQLPIGLVAHHFDKTLRDLTRMRRSSP